MNATKQIWGDSYRRESPQICFVVWATNQSPGLPETLATAYNPGMCLLALPVIGII